MRIGKLISLIILLTALPAWGGMQPTAGDLAIGEALQQDITVEPERVAHHLFESMEWMVTPPPRPHPLPATFPGLTSPPTPGVKAPRPDGR